MITMFYLMSCIYVDVQAAQRTFVTEYQPVNTTTIYATVAKQCYMPQFYANYHTYFDWETIETTLVRCDEVNSKLNCHPFITDTDVLINDGWLHQATSVSLNCPTYKALAFKHADDEDDSSGIVVPDEPS